MARDYDNLSHHESLRYDYLQKNIHYLGPRDKAELGYLEAKIAGKVEVFRPEQKAPRRPFPARPPQPRPLARQGFTPEGLPQFDPKAKQRRERSRQEELSPTPQSPHISQVDKSAYTPEGLPQLNNMSRRRRSTNDEAKVLRRNSELRSGKLEPWQASAGLAKGERQKLASSSTTLSVSKNKEGETASSLPKLVDGRRGRQQRMASKQSSKSKRLASTPKRKWLKRVAISIGLLLLTTLIGMIIMFFKGYNDIRQNTETAKAAEVEVFNGQETRDGTNILVLGTDIRLGQDSTESRTDSIMVVNIGNSDGKVKVVSFMRDTLINIPGVSYEDGVTTYYDQKLNTAFSIGEQNDRQGAEAIRLALKAHFDIDIKYYAMIDFSTFATAIDTIFPNGVKIDAKFSTVEGVSVDSVQVPDDLNAKDGIIPEQTIYIGEQQMDGRTLLNYARFRKDDSGDFGRTQRQQQVLTAILQQVKDPTKLFTGSAALGKIMGMTSTSVPYSFIIGNGISVLKDASNDVEQITVPEMGDWTDQYDAYGGLGLYIDFEKYQQKLAEAGFR